MLAPSSLRAEDAAVAEDVLGIGFQGLSLSEAAVASNKEEVVEGEAVAGCSKPVAVAGDAVEEAPAEKRRQMELTEEDIEWILDQEPWPVSPPPDKEILLKTHPPEVIDRLMELNLRVANAMASAQKDFFAFQERVRKDLAETGVVAEEDVSMEEGSEELDCMDNISDSDISNYSQEDEDEEV